MMGTLSSLQPGVRHAHVVACVMRKMEYPALPAFVVYAPTVEYAHGL